MNERSVVSFSLRKLSRDNSYSTYFNSRLKTCLAYQASALLAKLFNIRYEDILINLTIILMSHESERHRYYRARSKLALGDITQHSRSILVLVLAAQLLQDDVTFHHLSVLTLLALHGESLALLHHSHNMSIHNYIMKKMFQDHRTISALSCFFDAAKVLRFPNKRVKKIPHESVWGMWGICFVILGDTIGGYYLNFSIFLALMKVPGLAYLES